MQGDPAGLGIPDKVFVGIVEILGDRVAAQAPFFPHPAGDRIDTKTLADHPDRWRLDGLGLDRTDLGGLGLRGNSWHRPRNSAEHQQRQQACNHVSSLLKGMASRVTPLRGAGGTCPVVSTAGVEGNPGLPGRVRESLRRAGWHGPAAKQSMGGMALSRRRCRLPAQDHGAV